MTKRQSMCERCGSLHDPYVPCFQYEKSAIDSPITHPGSTERMRQYQHVGEPTETHKASNPKDMIGSGKAPLSLCPASLRAAASMAFMEGALKYGRFNWRLAGVRASIYYDALNRHMDAWFNGEETDPGSGLPHLYKAAACIAILIDAVEIGKLVDDRAPYVDMDGLYAELADEVARLKHAAVASRHPEATEPHQCTLADSPKPSPQSAGWYSKELLRRNPIITGIVAEEEPTGPEFPPPYRAGGQMMCSSEEEPAGPEWIPPCPRLSDIQRGSEKFDPETYIKAGGSMR